MKHKRNIILLLTLTACMVIFCSFPVFAAELTEAEVEQAVANQGKGAVTGNIFIWFLCAIAFLKVSQKIDSFMANIRTATKSDCPCMELLKMQEEKNYDW